VTDISLHRSPIREPEEGGSLIEDFERQETEGSGNGSFISLSLSLSLRSVTGIWREGSCTEASGSYVKDGPGNRASISMQWLHKENLEGGSLLGDPTDMSRKAVDMDHAPLYRFRKGNVKGGVLY
jgi:hypothetical protein